MHMLIAAIYVLLSMIAFGMGISDWYQGLPTTMFFNIGMGIILFVGAALECYRIVHVNRVNKP